MLFITFIKLICLLKALHPPRVSCSSLTGRILNLAASWIKFCSVLIIIEDRHMIWGMNGKSVDLFDDLMIIIKFYTFQLLVPIWVCSSFHDSCHAIWELSLHPEIFSFPLVILGRERDPLELAVNLSVWSSWPHGEKYEFLLRTWATLFNLCWPRKQDNWEWLFLFWFYYSISHCWRLF